MGYTLRRWNDMLALVLAVVLTACAAALALAQERPALPDTQYTPTARSWSTDGIKVWKHVGGAKHEDELVDEEAPALAERSPTPFTVDFHAIDLLNESNGFAGGAECANAAITWAELMTGDCDRVPALYRYEQVLGEDEWTKVELPGADTPGYIAAIAWLGPGRAMAVGGDGLYPEREEPLADPADDPAGHARAWLMEDGVWRELELPETMGALTAVDFSPSAERAATDCALVTPEGETTSECGVAGGYAKLWMWRDGAFAEQPFDSAHPDVFRGGDFKFRVRQVRFASGEANLYRAVAVTSGCCAPGDPARAADNQPRALLLSEGTRWEARRVVPDDDPLVVENDPAVRQAKGRQHLADSVYAVAVLNHVDNPATQVMSVVAAPGGPAPLDPFAEAPSRVVGDIPLLSRTNAATTTRVAPGALNDDGTSVDYTGGLSSEALNPRLSAMRLVAGDGDFAGQRRGPVDELNQPYSGRRDHIMDWAVGSWTANEQGIAYTTLETATATPSPLECDGTDQAVRPDGSYLDCGPRTTDETRSRRLYAMPTYALHAFMYTEDGAAAWAVGEKGAIMRLGGAGDGGGAKPRTPLGRREPAERADTTPYDAFRPATPAAPPGVVPPLAARPEDALDPPGWLSAGTPDPGKPLLQTLAVMSRDGREGWAFGDGRLVHYDGERWTPCDATGVPGQVPPDAACEGVRDLAGLTIAAAARIPFENDDDEGNDDRFEVMAVRGGGGFLRYSEGRWRELSAEEGSGLAVGAGVFQSMAFTAPDDGWAVGNGATAYLAHFDGTRWVDCKSSRDARVECGDAAPDDPASPLASLLTERVPGRFFLSSAGTRVYLAGHRPESGASSSFTAGSATYPAILRLDSADEQPQWHVEHDPRNATPPGEPGYVRGFSVAKDGDGYVGWAVGRFGTPAQDGADRLGDEARAALGGSTSAALRLTADGWAAHSADDPLTDYYLRGTYNPDDPLHVVTLPERGGEAAVVNPVRTGASPPVLRFDPADGDGRWGVLPTPFELTGGDNTNTVAGPGVLAPAGEEGGLWLGVVPRTGNYSSRKGSLRPSTTFYRYSDEQHRPVFEDMPHPVAERITTAVGAADGSLWVGTNGGVVYRYDRLTGWERIEIPGWEPTRLVSAGSRINAIAAERDGQGLIVGEGGRIAQLGSRIQLDAAAGRPCADGVAACGTSQDLHAVDVASDGSALAAGKRKALVYRPLGGVFRAIDPPAVSAGATFTGVSMPTPTTAYLTSDTGQLFRGTLEGGRWQWRLDAVDGQGRTLTIGDKNKPTALNAVAVDAGGHGYAVGDEGIVLERADGAWRRLRTGHRDNFLTVALPDPAGPTPGALIGGQQGIVLTLSEGEFHVARHADPYDPIVAATGEDVVGRVVGLALLPGTTEGQVEAWAALQVPPDPRAGRAPEPQALLHYTSHPDDTLLDGKHSVRPLPDAPLPRPGEIAFAAFGRTDCHSDGACREHQGSNQLNNVVPRRIAKELGERAKRPGGPMFTLFTGDISDASGRAGQDDVQTDPDTPLDRNVIHRRWTELVPPLFEKQGVPLFGALGGKDLSQVRNCIPSCTATGQAEQSRTNAPWREAMAAMPAPWGTTGDAPETDKVAFRPVTSGLDGAEPLGGAHTHYAFDVERDGERIARVAVVDTSQRSLAASDREQNPVEPGGQLAWLESVLCREGTQATTAATPCRVPRDLPTVVLSNTPTYTYSTNVPATDTVTDATAFEATLLRLQVTNVVQGRVGWNGRYFATAPGVHYPCPGGQHPTDSDVPAPASPPRCQATETDTAAAEAALDEAADALQSLAPPEVREATEETQGTVTDLGNGNVAGLLDFVVASGGGGRLAAEGGEAADGFWHGYTLVRLLPGSTDPRTTVVEQRPLFDWITVTAKKRRIGPGGTVTIEGVGREPVGTDQPMRYDRIDSTAITHRYDLVRADPEKPWLPDRDADGNYVPLPESVAQIERVTGVVRAGRGNQERAYALAILSVDDQAAAVPLVFEPRKSFEPKPALVSDTLSAVQISEPARTPATIVLGTQPATLPPTAPPPTSPPPGTLNVSMPPPLPFSAPPPINATPTATPPPPPPAPPPPASEGAAPLNLALKVSGLNVAPQMSTFPPPAPPVNPAPPGGARKEARQRQAAVAKSEQGGDGNEEGADAHGRSDAVDSPNSAMTRLDQGKGNGSMAFTAYGRRDQPSAWARGALYGGGLTLAAFLMAMTWTVVRPRPRRRTPDVPAPAYATRHRR